MSINQPSDNIQLNWWSYCLHL